jgi:hypothetical protein
VVQAFVFSQHTMFDTIRAFSELTACVATATNGYCAPHFPEHMAAPKDDGYIEPSVGASTGYIACKCRSHFPQILAIGAGGEPSARGVRDFYFVYCSSSFVPSTAFFLVTHVHGILLTW